MVKRGVLCVCLNTTSWAREVKIGGARSDCHGRGCAEELHSSKGEGKDQLAMHCCEVGWAAGKMS